MYKQLPQNDIELNALIAEQKPFIKKYFDINITAKSDNKFRDYVCESLLGMTNGGYQQLQASWGAVQSASVSGELKESLESLPSAFWILVSDEGKLLFNLSGGRSGIETSAKYGLQRVEHELFDEIDPDLELAILEHYSADQMHMTYPNGNKYGAPELAFISSRIQLISDYYGIHVTDESSFYSGSSCIDIGDDSVEVITFYMVKNNI